MAFTCIHATEAIETILTIRGCYRHAVTDMHEVLQGMKLRRSQERRIRSSTKEEELSSQPAWLSQLQSFLKVSSGCKASKDVLDPDQGCVGDDHHPLVVVEVATFAKSIMRRGLQMHVTTQMPS